MMNFALGTARIGWRHIGLSFLSGIVLFVVVEIEKMFARKNLKK